MVATGGESVAQAPYTTNIPVTFTVPAKSEVNVTGVSDFHFGDVPQTGEYYIAAVQKAVCVYRSDVGTYTMNLSASSLASADGDSIPLYVYFEDLDKVRVIASSSLSHLRASNRANCASDEFATLTVVVTRPEYQVYQTPKLAPLGHYTATITLTVSPD